MRRGLGCFIVGAVLFFAASVFLAAGAGAQERGEPLDLDAKQLGYTDNGQTLVASGEVRLRYRGYEVLAEQLTWSPNVGELRATGGATLILPDKTLLRAQEIHLQDHLETGTLQDLTAELADTAARITARSGTRDGDIYILHRASYTVCECHDMEESPNEKTKKKKWFWSGEPLWDIGAARVKLNRDSGLVTYNHALFKVKGVPLLYSPFFAHVSPEVERRGGLLAPAIHNSSVTGWGFSVPIYIPFGPTFDITLTPRFASKVGYVQNAEVRHLLPFGQYEFEGMLTPSGDPSQIFRSWVFGKGAFHIKELELGFRTQLISDRDVLWHFGHDDPDTLENRGWAEYIHANTFARVDAGAYNTTNRETETFTRDDGTMGEEYAIAVARMPQFLPHIQMEQQWRLPLALGQFTLAGDVLHLSRPAERTLLRSSVSGEWEKQLVYFGGVLDLSVRGAADVHDQEDNRDAATLAPIKERAHDNNIYQTHWRGFGTFNARASYPLFHQSAAGRYLVEPLAQVTYTAGKARHGAIFDEDAVGADFNNEEPTPTHELTAANLLLPDRFIGADWQETGLHIAYALRARAQWGRAWGARLLVGQSWQMETAQGFESGSGLEGNFSDIVARAELHLFDAALTHEMRLKQNTGEGFRQETEFAWHWNDRVHTSLGHVYAPHANDPAKDIQQFFADATLKIGERWTLDGGLRYDFNDDENRGDTIVGRFVNWNIGTAYEDECLRLRLSYAQSTEGINTISQTFGLELTLKTLTSTSITG